MSLILNIDTAVQTSSVCLAENYIPLAVKINPSQKDSAAWLHVAINELLQEKKLSLRQLDAVAVAAGPGSYTGLRVGMSTAKGLCYALNKPLITINTLHLMAFAANNNQADLLCPMIDARRMEVFAAIFDHEFNTVLSPSNIILRESSFESFLKGKKMLFFGNGSLKFQSVTNNPNALFSNIEVNASSMPKLTYTAFSKGDFANLAYSEPFYGKDFHSTAN